MTKIREPASERSASQQNFLFSVIHFHFLDVASLAESGKKGNRSGC